MYYFYLVNHRSSDSEGFSQNLVCCERVNGAERPVGERLQGFVLTAKRWHQQPPHELPSTTGHGSSRSRHVQNGKHTCNAGKMKVCSELVFMTQQFPP